MKLITRFTLLSIAFFFLITFSISCKKEISNSGSAQQDEELASETSSRADAESEFIFNDVFDNVMGVSDDVGLAGVGVFGKMNNTGSGTLLGARTDACYTVSITHLNPPDAFPVKIVIDFGTGCQGRDGRTRSGKIITTYTARLLYPGAKATTTFDNYHVDSIKVEGTHVITNQSTLPTSTANIVFIWKAVVEGAKLTKPSGNYSEWNSTKTITQIEGSATPILPLDDIYKVEGSANGKVKRGDLLVAWKAEITEPLIKKFSCRWIVKGVLKVIRINLSSSSQWVGIINYGGGDCDNKAKVTINGVDHEITLP